MVKPPLLILFVPEPVSHQQMYPVARLQFVIIFLAALLQLVHVHSRKIKLGTGGIVSVVSHLNLHVGPFSGAGILRPDVENPLLLTGERFGPVIRIDNPDFCEFRLFPLMTHHGIQKTDERSRMLLPAESPFENDIVV